MYCQQCGNPTEERQIDGRLRPVCVACGSVTWLDPKVAVAVVIERGGKILLGLRGDSTREPGKWGLPAGFVDRGERVEDAAVREMAEETGLHVTLGPLLTAISATGDPVILLVYPALAAAGVPAAGDDLVKLGWFAPDALPDLAFGHDADILAIWESWRSARATA